jgi:DNA-binding NarL/FixJ family response regulator
MRDLFISAHNNLLENWIRAFEQAEVYASVADVSIKANSPSLFWLHVDANDGQWLSASIVKITEKFINPKIIVLANAPNQAEAALAISEGAVGYCHAYSAADVLIEVKAVVSHGGIWLGQDLLQYLISTSRQIVKASPETVSAALKLLTPREKEVALEVSAGLTNKEIARKLNVTERTVKAHLSACFERLSVKDRLQLALILNNPIK